MANVYQSDNEITTDSTESKSPKNSGGRKMLAATYFLIIIAAFALALMLMRPGPITRSPDRDTPSDSPRGGVNEVSAIRTLSFASSAT